MIEQTIPAVNWILKSRENATRLLKRTAILSLMKEKEVCILLKTRIMATEKTIKGKRSRYYNDGYIWVSTDGTVVAAKQKNGSWKYFAIKTDDNGEKFVETRYKTIYIKKAVFTCFCYCDDPNKTQIWYKDGNPANLYYNNLIARAPQTLHTTASTFELRNGLTVTKEGKVFYGGQEECISDCIGDSDTDLICCIDPYISNPKGRGKLWMDDLMAEAGYVAGEKYDFSNPVILHNDNDPMNFHSDNLEYVEDTDTRYIEYKKKKYEWKHQRNIELNPGQQLPPGW